MRRHVWSAMAASALLLAGCSDSGPTAEDTAAEVEPAVEEYLRGVVPSEMYESANIEALKAQAICART